MATIFFMNTGYQSPDYYFEWSKGCQEFKERNNMSKSFATFDIFLSGYVMQYASDLGFYPLSMQGCIFLL